MDKCSVLLHPNLHLFHCITKYIPTADKLIVKVTDSILLQYILHKVQILHASIFEQV